MSFEAILLVPGFDSSVPTHRVYIDFTSGSNLNSGTSASPYLTLDYATSQIPAGLASGDRVYFLIRNGSGGTATAQPCVFNNAAWAGVNIFIEPDGASSPPWVASGTATDYIIRVFLATCVPASLTAHRFVWTLNALQIGIQGLGNPGGGASTQFTISNGSCTWASWNVGNILLSCASTPGSNASSVDSVTTTGMARVVVFLGHSGTLRFTENTFGLGAGAGTWRVIDYSQAASRAAPSIYSSGNTWTGNTASGFTFLGVYDPIITTSDKTWLFADDFYLNGAASSGKFLNIDDCGVGSTHNLRVRFLGFPTGRKSVLRMDTSGQVFAIGRNLGAYTNSQKPRLKTLTDECTQKLALLTFENCDWDNANATSGAALLAIKIGVMQTDISDSKFTCPNSDGHSCNFLANDCTLTSTYLQGELPILAFGDRLTVTDCYSIGVRPFVAAKTGGGQDEATQSHTVEGCTFVTTSANADYSAFDTYGWQANDPYGPVWYDSIGADGTNYGLYGWTVRNNTFVSTDLTETSYPVGLGRPVGATDHAGGKCKTQAEIDSFMADGNGGDGVWGFGGTVFENNTLYYGSAPATDLD